MKIDRRKLGTVWAIFIIIAFAVGCLVGAAIVRIDEAIGQEDTLTVEKFPITNIVGQCFSGHLVQFWRDMDDNNKPDRIEVRLYGEKRGVSLPIVVAFDTTDSGLCDSVYAFDKEKNFLDIWGEKLTLTRVSSTAIGKSMRGLKLFNESFSAKPS